MLTNNERDDYDAACGPCDECRIVLLPGEAVSPPEMAEKFCVLCWPIVQAEIEDKTQRIENVPMASMVWGSR
jgi:predicted sulfurtransferase